jgi:hypothetical protein
MIPFFLLLTRRYDMYRAPDEATLMQTVKAMKDTGLYAAGVR